MCIVVVGGPNNNGSKRRNGNNDGSMHQYTNYSPKIKNKKLNRTSMGNGYMNQGMYYIIIF